MFLKILIHYRSTGDSKLFLKDPVKSNIKLCRYNGQNSLFSLEDKNNKVLKNIEVLLKYANTQSLQATKSHFKSSDMYVYFKCMLKNKINPVTVSIATRAEGANSMVLYQK